MLRIFGYGLVCVGMLVAANASVARASPAAATNIKSLYDGARVMQNLQTLSGFAPLTAAGPGEWAAGDFIAGRFANYGLQVDVQELAAPYFVDRGGIVTVAGVDYVGNAILASKSADLTANLVWVGAGAKTDFAAAAVSGRIAFMVRGGTEKGRRPNTFAPAAANARRSPSSDPPPGRRAERGGLWSAPPGQPCRRAAVDGFRHQRTHG